MVTLTSHLEVKWLENFVIIVLFFNIEMNQRSIKEVMTRTVRRRHTKHPTRDGNHNPVCIDEKCEDCV